MDPIAVVNWKDHKGNENIKICYTQKSLDKLTDEIIAKNLMSYTCLCSPDAAIPLRPPRRHIKGA